MMLTRGGGCRGSQDPLITHIDVCPDQLDPIHKNSTYSTLGDLLLGALEFANPFQQPSPPRNRPEKWRGKS